MPRAGALILFVIAGHMIGCTVLVVGWVPGSGRPDLAMRMTMFGVLSGVVGFFLGLGAILTPRHGRRRAVGLTLLYGCGYALFLAVTMACFFLSENCPPYFKQRLQYFGAAELICAVAALFCYAALGGALVSGTRPIGSSADE